MLIFFGGVVVGFLLNHFGGKVITSVIAWYKSEKAKIEDKI